MSSIPLPALSIHPPQQENPAEQLGKMVQMKSMLQNQQMKQGEIQLQQQQIKDQQAMTTAMKNWDGKDYDALSKSVLQNGGSANAATQIQQHGLTIKKTVSDIAAQDATAGSKNLETFIGKQKALGDGLMEGADPKVVPDEQLHQWALGKIQTFAQGGILDQQTAQGLSQKVQSIQDPAQLRTLVEQAAKSSMGAKAVAEQQKTIAEAGKDTAQAGEADTVAAKNRAESSFYAANPSAGAPGVPAETVSLMDYMRKPPAPGEPMHTPSNYPAWKAKQEAIQTEPIKVHQAAAEAAVTQPYKIQTAQAEGRARQLIQGMEKPVYALVPQADGTTAKHLMSATDALQAGIHTMLPVTEKEVGEDTMLINRLGDVRQKIARYEQSLSALGATVSAKDQSNIAALIGKGGIKVGAFGTELPMDRLNAALDKENIKGLSDDAKKLLVSYYNARESMQGYTRVLTGSGRSNEKAMELNLDALPNPGTADKAYAVESLKQFHENLDIVGQGLPKIPGIKSPEEIEAGVTAPKAKAGKNNDPLGIR
jgi:hypothetical protein